jgi:hypothetical protein
LGSGYQWEGGRQKERGSEDEYCGNILYMYVNEKIRLVETIPGLDGGKDEGE